MPLLQNVSLRLRDVQARLHHAGRRGLARAVFSVPALQRHDPRRKLITFKSHCRTISRFPIDPDTEPADWYLALHAPKKIRRQPSISVDQTQAEQFRAATQHYQSGEEFEIPEIFLASLSRATLLRNGLITLSRDGDIFIESALSKPEVLEAHGILDTLLRPRSSATLPGSYCLLGTPWSAGYYHWMLEALPRLAALERFSGLNDCKLIIAEPLSRFQRETLALTGVPESRITRLTSAASEVERLYFPQIPAPTGNPSPRAAAWLRSRLLRPAPAATRATRKLYISRCDAPQRRLLNESETIGFVQRNGFEVVSLGDTSVADQIKLFSEARTIIAPHGAGVTNVLFSPASATVVEFFGTNYINGCYWALANICGHRHAFLTGEPTGLDYKISLRQLEQLLTVLGEN